MKLTFSLLGMKGKTQVKFILTSFEHNTVSIMLLMHLVLSGYHGDDITLWLYLHTYMI